MEAQQQRPRCVAGLLSRPGVPVGWLPPVLESAGVLTWNQQRVEFVHDGSGQMMMRVGQAEDWLEVQPFWTVDHSLCWGSVYATGVIPLE